MNNTESRRTGTLGRMPVANGTRNNRDDSPSLPFLHCVKRTNPRTAHVNLWLDGVSKSTHVIYNSRPDIEPGRLKTKKPDKKRLP